MPSILSRIIVFSILLSDVFCSTSFATERQWQRIPKACSFALMSGFHPEFTEEHINKRLSMIESFWEKIFADRGWPFEEVRIVLYSGSTQASKQLVTSGMGPSYSPLDKAIFLSMDFEKLIAEKIGPMSDALLTLILSHEFGHHIQNITGSNARGAQLLEAQLQNNNSAFMNAFFPPVEKQADCLAGVFFNHLRREGLASQNEINDAIARMVLMGDDIQMLIRLLKGQLLGAGGAPHASGADRSAWFNKGLESGDPLVCETFVMPVLAPR